MGFTIGAEFLQFQSHNTITEERLTLTTPETGGRQTPRLSFISTKSCDPIVLQYFNRYAISFLPSLHG